MSRPVQSDGRVHGVVIALRRADGRWLAIRRAYTLSAAPGKVCFPGGAVEVGETQEQAVVREAREELGLDVRPIERVWRWDSPATPLTLWGWTAETTGWDALKPDPAEVAEVIWMTADELPAHPDALPTNAEFCANLQDYLKNRPFARGTGL